MKLKLSHVLIGTVSLIPVAAIGFAFTLGSLMALEDNGAIEKRMDCSRIPMCMMIRNTINEVDSSAVAQAPVFKEAPQYIRTDEEEAKFQKDIQKIRDAVLFEFPVLARYAARLYQDFQRNPYTQNDYKIVKKYNDLCMKIINQWDFLDEGTTLKQYMIKNGMDSRTCDGSLP